MTTDEVLSMSEVQAISEEAYVFSFPMLMGYRAAFGMFIAAGAPSYRGPLNQLHGDAQTLDHTFRDVIPPNADTPYSVAGLDLRAEPLVLEVPEVSDRYYVMQFEDLFGTNPHYVGRDPRRFLRRVALRDRPRLHHRAYAAPGARRRRRPKHRHEPIPPVHLVRVPG